MDFLLYCVGVVYSDRFLSDQSVILNYPKFKFMDPISSRFSARSPEYLRRLFTFKT